jgi:hypothetical protein
LQRDNLDLPERERRPSTFGDCTSAQNLYSCPWYFGDMIESLQCA